jgi:aarF domain-containing kinase
VLLAALSPAAFLALAGDNDDPTATGELEMLAASREELKKRIPEDANIFVKISRRIYLLLDKYVFEVLATGLRFVHLVVIFVPVLVTFPAIWFGPKVKDRDEERVGALLWYQFLVFSMERAGPAFIKVCPGFRLYSCVRGLISDRLYL